MLSKEWSELSSTDLSANFQKQLVNNWMLVTAGSPDALGTMTINWGGNGFIWKKNVIFMVIRESRNTLTFLKQYPDFSLASFDESYQTKLTFCGRNSGHDVNKVAACAFTPCFYGDTKTPFFNEAKSVLICHQIYRGLMHEEDFIDGTTSPLWETWYNTGAHKGDRHNLIIASVEKVLIKSGKLPTQI